LEDKKKHAQFGAVLDKFRFGLQISLEGMEILKIGKANDQLQPLPRSAKKLGELSSSNKKVIGEHVDPSKINTAHAV